MKSKQKMDIGSKMKKIISLLMIAIFVFSTVSGLLLNQLIVVQDKNSELKKEIFDANIQLKDDQNIRLPEIRINELEEQLINKVNITTFRTEGDFPPVNGVWWYCNSIVFVVTVENFGINDVENLSVICNDPYMRSINIDILKAGKSKTVSLSYELGDNGFYASISTLATLMMDNTIIDKKSLLETF